MAEGLLAHALKVEEEPLRSLAVVSAGVAAYDGEPASVNSVRALKKVGIDIEEHRSQRITPEMLERSVLILVMTESHRSVIQSAMPELETPVLLMRELLPPPARPEIPDPYGMDLESYEATRDSMVEAIPVIVEHLKELTSKPPAS